MANEQVPVEEVFAVNFGGPLPGFKLHREAADGGLGEELPWDLPFGLLGLVQMCCLKDSVEGSVHVERSGYARPPCGL